MGFPRVVLTELAIVRDTINIGVPFLTSKLINCGKSLYKHMRTCKAAVI